MRRVAKVSLWLLLGTILLALLLASLTGWVLMTNQGARFALRMADRFAPVSIQYEALSGTVWRGLKAQSLGIYSDTPDLGFSAITLRDADLSWRLSSLLSGRFYLGHVDVEQLVISLSASEEAPSDAESESLKLPPISLPIGLRVQLLKLGLLQIRPADETQAPLFELSSLATSLNFVGPELTLNDTHVTLYEQTFRGDLQLTMAEKWSLDAKIDYHGNQQIEAECAFEPVLNCAGQLAWSEFAGPWLPQARLGAGKAEIALHDMRLTVEAQSEAQYEDKALDLDIKTDVLLDEQSFENSRVTVHLNESQAAFTGQGRWQSPIRIQGDLDLAQVALAPWVAALPPETRLSAHSEFKLEIAEALTLQAQNQIHTLSFGEQALSGRLDVALNGDQFELHTLDLTTEGASLSGEGRANLSDKTVTAALTLSAQALESIAPGLNGDLNAQVNLNTGERHIQLQSRLSSSNLRSAFGETRDAKLQLSASLPRAVKTLELYTVLEALRLPELTLSTASLSVSGTEIDDLSLSVNGTTQSHALNLNARVAAYGLNIENLALNGETRFRRGFKEWRGVLNSLTLRNADIDTQALMLSDALTVALSPDAVTLGAACFSQASAQLCVNESEFIFGERFAGSAEIRNLPLSKTQSPLVPYLPPVPAAWDLEGQFNIDVSVQAALAQGKIDKLDINAQASTHDAAIVRRAQSKKEKDERYVVQQFKARLQGDNAQLTAQISAQVDPGQSVVLDAQMQNWLSVSRSLSAQLNADLPELKVFQVFLPATHDLTGKASAELRYQEKAGQEPQLDGQIKVSELAFVVPATGTKVRGLELLATSQQRHLDLDLHGKIGDGSLKAQGKLDLSIQPELALDAWLEVQGDGLVLVDVEDKRLIASPNLRLSNSDIRTWDLSGDITVNRSFFHVEELPPNTAKISPDATVHGSTTGEEGSAFTLTSRLDIYLAEDNHFQGFGLDAALAGSLKFERDASQANSLHGVVHIPQGQFAKFGRKLSIKNGRLIFSGPIDNPRLDVLAVREIDSIVVGVRIGGTPSRLSSELYSNTNMSQADILSYILTGKPLSGAGKGESTNLEAAALNLGLKQALPALQKLGGELGLTSIELETDEKTNSSSVAAGKQVNDDLFVKYEYGLVGAVGRFVVEYRLTDKLRVVVASGLTDTIDLNYTWNSSPIQIKDSAKPKPASEAPEENKEP